MKKFLTFVLVLAMVLSVSSFAMAAGTVHKVGTYQELVEKLASTGLADGDTIELTANIAYPTNGTGLINVTKSITIDGGANKYGISGYGTRGSNKTTLAINNNGTSQVTVTLKNLTIVNGVAGGRAIETRGGIAKLTIDNCNISCTGGASGSNYPQTLTIGGDQASLRAQVEIRNSNISNTTHYPIITFNKVDMSIDNSTISGYCAVFFREASSSNGSGGSVLTATGSTFNCPTNYDEPSNSFGVFPMRDTNITIKLTDCKVDATAAGAATQSLVKTESGATDHTFSLTIEGESEVKGDILDVSAEALTTAETKITGGTFTDDPSAYTGDTLVAEVGSVIIVGEEAIEKAANESQTPVNIKPISGTGDLDLDTTKDNQVVITKDMKDKVTINGQALEPVASDAPQQIPSRPQTTAKPSTGNGISVKYNGGNSFSTSNPAVPTGVEIDGVPVSFNGTGSNFTVGCINPGAKWVTVRWNSTTVTTNFTPDGLVECTTVSIPKTGDMPIWAAIAAFFGF